MTACPICSDTLRGRLATRDSSRPADLTKWIVGWCDACSFGRITNPVTPAVIAGFYTTGYYTHGGATRRPRPRYSILDRLIRFVACRVDRSVDFSPAEVTGQTACDVGCGAGNNLLAFAAAGFRAVGIEPDAAARDLAGSRGCEVVAGTAEAPPPSSARYDVVLMSHSLEHCADPLLAIGNCAAMLAPGGTLVIEVPNNAALGFRWLGASWFWADIPRHLSFFTEQSLRAALRARGLTVTRTIYLGYARQFSREWINRTGSGWWALPLLLLTAIAPRRLKYDSVRVHAKRS